MPCLNECISACQQRLILVLAVILILARLALGVTITSTLRYAEQIAKELDAPLDVLIVRKLGGSSAMNMGEHPCCEDLTPLGQWSQDAPSLD